jgi:hypothetical protein
MNDRHSACISPVFVEIRSLSANRNGTTKSSGLKTDNTLRGVERGFRMVPRPSSPDSSHTRLVAAQNPGVLLPQM